MNQNKRFYCIPYIHRSRFSNTAVLYAAHSFRLDHIVSLQFSPFLAQRCVTFPFLTVQPGNQELLDYLLAVTQVHPCFLRILKSFPIHYKRSPNILKWGSFTCYFYLIVTATPYFEKQTSGQTGKYTVVLKPQLLLLWPDCTPHLSHLPQKCRYLVLIGRAG